jgi:polar amino acid transport system substrate-binding protein
VVLTVACTPGGTSTLDRVRRDGFIRVGYAVEAPYAFVEAGRVTGEAPAVAGALLRRLGIDSVVWVRREFAALVPDLRRGRFDLVAAGMFITAERERVVAFTRPTFCVGPALLVRRGNPRRLHGYEDTRLDPAARLAVLAGAVEQAAAEAAGVPPERLVAVPDQRTGLAALRQGRVDAFALSAPSVNHLVATDTSRSIERAEPFHAPRLAAVDLQACGALAVRRGDRELLRHLNREITSFVGTAAHLRLVERFGFSRAELPPGPAEPPDAEGP